MVELGLGPELTCLRNGMNNFGIEHMKQTKWRLAVGMITLLGLGLAGSGGWAETPAEKDQRMAWFREARFGMFIHWGIYAVPAGEWKGAGTTANGSWKPAVSRSLNMRSLSGNSTR